VVCPDDVDTCSIKYYQFAIIFAGVQLFVSQIPNMDSLWWISAIGAIMSFGCESSGGGAACDAEAWHEPPGWAAWGWLPACLLPVPHRCHSVAPACVLASFLSSTL
jgi:hypothetical protein